MKARRKKKSRTRGISFPSDLEVKGLERAAILDISFSKYIQKLIKSDLEKVTAEQVEVV